MLTTLYSPWLILLCLAVGAGYAALQYSAKAPWSRQLNYGLAALRFAVVSFLCYLLLGPFVKTTTTRTEQPTVVLAVDNSQSVELFTPKNVLSQASTGLARLAETLRGKGFTVEARALTPTPGGRRGSIRCVLAPPPLTSTACWPPPATPTKGATWPAWSCSATAS
ncbi:hypothetical protein ACFQT0_19975 [Hymenobacter humi]|uniref:VWA domain-containing protein n=1 Tax=Hymenobacter humi TaxID=1411620 RepID=A0ABW2U794_9BACT